MLFFNKLCFVKFIHADKAIFFKLQMKNIQNWKIVLLFSLKHNGPWTFKIMNRMKAARGTTQPNWSYDRGEWQAQRHIFGEQREPKDTPIKVRLFIQWSWKNWISIYSYLPGEKLKLNQRLYFKSRNIDAANGKHFKAYV